MSEADPRPSAVPRTVADVVSDEPTPGGGTLRWGIRKPSAIVPSKVVDPDGLHIVGALFDSLTSYDADLEPVPAAAQWWSSDAEHRVWTFHLRDEAVFHDGSPVTAGDFAFAWQLAVRAGGVHLADVEGYADVRSGMTGRFRGVNAIDEQTLEVRLSSPRADFASVVAHPSLAPVPREAWQADPQAFEHRPVGNGPFRMAEEWGSGSFIRLVRFERWMQWSRVDGDDRPLDEILFRIADIDTTYVAFQQGRVDVTTIPDGAFDQAVGTYGRSEDGYTGPGVLDGAQASLYFYGFNTLVEPFDEVEVRRAVSLAVDREQLAGDVLEGNVVVARSALPPGLPGYSGLACRSCVHSPATARRLFAEHGVTELELWFNSDGGHEIVAEQVAADLAAVGVDVTFSNLAFDDYLGALQAGTPNLFRFGWAAESAEAGAFLHALFHSDSVPTEPGAGGNYMRYADDRVDAALEEARSLESETSRWQLIRRAERIALGEDQAIVPLFSYRHRTVVARRVQGLVVNALGLTALEDVTLDTGV